MELPAGTVTLVFTDIEGSTRLLQELGREGYVRALTQHRRLLREAITAHGGVEVEMQGDSFHFAFPYARDAVAAAAAGQRALHEHEWESQPIRVRMGLHTGEPMQADGLYAGIDVHRAARVMSAGHGGQVLLSARTVDLVEGELPDGLAASPVGTYLLKDFERPEPLAQLLADGLPADFPPPRADLAPSDAAPGTTGPSIDLRRRWMLAVAAIIVAVGAAAAIFVLRDSGGHPVRDVVVSIDPGRNKVQTRASVGGTPTSIAVGNHAIWVLNAADATLTKLDTSGRALRTLGMSGAPTDVTTTAGAVWVAERPNRLVRLDPTTGHTTATVTLKTSPTPFLSFMWLGAGRAAVWVTAQDRLARIDLGTLRVRMLRLPTPDWGPLAVTSDAIWESTHDTLYRLDPESGRVAASVKFPQGPIVVAAGSVWALNRALNVVGQIDTRSNTLVRTIPVGENPSGIAFGEGSVWVASQDGSVTRIDPTTARVIATLHVGGSPQDITVGYGRIWVSVG